MSDQPTSSDFGGNSGDRPYNGIATFDALRLDGSRTVALSPADPFTDPFLETGFKEPVLTTDLGGSNNPVAGEAPSDSGPSTESSASESPRPPVESTASAGGDSSSLDAILDPLPRVESGSITDDLAEAIEQLTAMRDRLASVERPRLEKLYDAAAREIGQMIQVITSPLTVTVMVAQAAVLAAQDD